MCCTSHTRGRSKYVDGYEASNANNDLVMHAAREHGESKHIDVIRIEHAI